MDSEPFIGDETCSMGISQPAEAIKNTIIEIWAEQPRQGELHLADRGNYAQFVSGTKTPDENFQFLYDYKSIS